MDTKVEQGTAIDIVISKGPKPDSEPTPSPTPSTEPQPTQTPVPTPTPIGAAYYTFRLSTAGRENPIVYGNSSLIYFELKQGNTSVAIIPEGNFSVTEVGDIILKYDQYPSEFRFRLDTQMYSDLSEGSAEIELWATDETGNHVKRDTWWIELQEFTE